MGLDSLKIDDRLVQSGAIDRYSTVNYSYRLLRLCTVVTGFDYRS